MTTLTSRTAPPNPLAGYEDWPAAARSARCWTGPDDASTALGRVLGLRELSPSPAVTTDDHRVIDGVSVTRMRWTVGYGPDSTGWLLRPAGETGPLPGVLAMHCHGGVRSVGAEQLLDLGGDDRPRAVALRGSAYQGRAPANDLARRGYAVLAHDTFSWGSRAFDLTNPTHKLGAQIAALEALWRERGIDPSAEERFDQISSLHEDMLAKAAGTLGQTFAGMVLTDDLVALQVLADQPGTDSTRLGTFGFSGGGGRSLLLAALDHRVSASVVTCMMSTFASLIPDYLDAHSWLLHVPGLWSFADWPELTASGRARFLVQYRSDDALFPPDGMRAAHDDLTRLHAGTDRYQGRFHDGGHAFDAEMQAEAWSFFDDALRSTSRTDLRYAQ